MADDKNHSVGFSLYKIHLDQFAVIDDNYIDNEVVSLEVGIQYAVNQEKKRLRCSIRVGFIQKECTFMVIQANHEYDIDPDSWELYEDSDHKKILFPKGFVRHLAFLTVGSLRGMLYVKTENTKFSRYFLPTINLNDLIPADIEFDI